MTKFYICSTNTVKGPYHLNQLEQLNIQSDDLIWSDAYGENIKAREVPEFAAYFKKKNVYTPRFSRTYSMPYKEKILYSLLAILVLMIGYYVVVM